MGGFFNRIVPKAKDAIKKKNGQSGAQQNASFDSKLNRQAQRSQFGSGSTVLSQPQENKTLLGS